MINYWKEFRGLYRPSAGQAGKRRAGMGKRMLGCLVLAICMLGLGG